MLLLYNSFGASRNWTVGSSDGVIFILLAVQCTKCIDACTDGIVGSFDSALFLLFLCVFNLDLAST
jgi:hypothetical protein